jgi:hypothetical protein
MSKRPVKQSVKNKSLSSGLYRRPWSYTRSADLEQFVRIAGALAGYTAGGELRPALRVTGTFQRGCLSSRITLLQAATW